MIVATQMLESMVAAPSPTRAEASDVATAVYDGADAVMLSAESAAGKYPIEAVSIMDRIIRRTEQHRLYRSLVAASEPEVEDSPPHAVAAAAATLADAIEAAAIVAFTSSGTTAARIARKRPNVPILAATSDTAVSRRLSLYWGAHSVLGPEIDSYEAMVDRAAEVAAQEGFAQAPDLVVAVAGIPFGRAGTTNNLRVVELGRKASGCNRRRHSTGFTTVSTPARNPRIIYLHPRPHPEVRLKGASKEGSRDRGDFWSPPSRSVDLRSTDTSG